MTVVGRRCLTKSRNGACTLFAIFTFERVGLFQLFVSKSSRSATVKSTVNRNLMRLFSIVLKCCNQNQSQNTTSGRTFPAAPKSVPGNKTILSCLFAHPSNEHLRPRRTGSPNFLADWKTTTSDSRRGRSATQVFPKVFTVDFTAVSAATTVRGQERNSRKIAVASPIHDRVSRNGRNLATFCAT